MKTIQELIPLIHKWAEEREIFDKSTPFYQLINANKEVGELIKVCYDYEKKAIQEATGNAMIFLINYCKFINEDVLLYIETATEILPCKKRNITFLAVDVNSHLSLILSKFSYKKNGIKIPDLEDMLDLFNSLHNIALLESTTLEECLNIAYNEIKNRTGKIINGKFIKDEK
jgi:hypothetical protein